MRFAPQAVQQIASATQKRVTPRVDPRNRFFGIHLCQQRIWHRRCRLTKQRVRRSDVEQRCERSSRGRGAVGAKRATGGVTSGGGATAATS